MLGASATESYPGAAPFPADTAVDQHPQKDGYAKGRSTRSEILAAAVRVFSRKGYHAASLRDILQDLGITKGAFYHHWASKEDLALEILRKMKEVVAEKGEGFIKNCSMARERITALFALYKDLSVREEWQFMRLYVAFSHGIRAGNKRLRAEMLEGFLQHGQLWTDFLEQGQQEGSVRKDLSATALSELIFVAITGNHSTSSASEQRPSIVEILDSLQTLILIPPDGSN